MTCINISYAMNQTKLFLDKHSKGRLSVLCAHSFHHTKYGSLLSNLPVHLPTLTVARIYLQCQNVYQKQAYCITRVIRLLSNAKMETIKCLETRKETHFI